MTPVQTAEAISKAFADAEAQAAFVQQTIYLDVTFHRPGVKRKGDLTKVQTQADKSQLRLSKNIVNSPAYTALVKVQRDFRKWLKARSVWSPLRRGIARLPVPLIGKIYDRLDHIEKLYMKRANEFLEEYPSLVQKAKEDLKDQWNAANYPSLERLGAAFWVERRLFDLARPSESKLGPKVASQENLRAAAEIEQDFLMVKAALRLTLRSLVDHLAERLAPAADGSKKQFGNTTVGKLVEFVELLPFRNVVDDTALAECANQAKKLLEGYTPEDFKSNDDDGAALRAHVSSKLFEIKGVLDGLVEEMPERQIVLAGEDSEEDE